MAFHFNIFGDTPGRTHMTFSGSSCKPHSSSDVLSLEAAVSSSLSLSHTSSEIRLGDKNLHLLEALMAAHTRQEAGRDSRVQPANTYIYSSYVAMHLAYVSTLPSGIGRKLN